MIKFLSFEHEAFLNGSRRFRTQDEERRGFATKNDPSGETQKLSLSEV